MKPENPAATRDAAIARAPSATDPGNEKRNDKKLKLTLKAGHSAGAVVLHCQGRIMFRREARALSTIVAEVLPSARRMMVDLAGVDSVDSGGLGELVRTHMWAEAAGYTLKFASPQKIGSTPLRNHQPGVGPQCIRQRSGGNGGDGSGRSAAGVGTCGETSAATVERPKSGYHGGVSS